MWTDTEALTAVAEYPLSAMQEGMVFLSQADSDHQFYEDFLLYDVRARCDDLLLRAAFAELVAEHPVLRTSIDVSAYPEPIQTVWQTAPVPWLTRDLRDLPADDQRAQVQADIDVERLRRIDLAMPPLLRVRVYRLADDLMKIVLHFHHAILDGWSAATAMAQWLSRYAELLDGVDATGTQAPPEFFAEFIALEKAAVADDRHREFWRRELKEIQGRPLPVRNPEAALQARNVTVVPPGLISRIQDAATGARVPFKSVLLGAHMLFLAREFGYSEPVTGLVVNGRPERRGAESGLGVFLNTIPFRIPMTADSSAEYLGAVFEHEIEVLPYRRFPLAEIQRMNHRVRPFDVLFNYVHFRVLNDVGGGAVTVLAQDAVEPIELPLCVTVSRFPAGDEMTVELIHDERYVDAGEAARLGRGFIRALTDLVEDGFASFPSAPHAIMPAPMPPPLAPQTGRATETVVVADADLALVRGNVAGSGSTLAQHCLAALAVVIGRCSGVDGGFGLRIPAEAASKASDDEVLVVPPGLLDRPNGHALVRVLAEQPRRRSAVANQVPNEPGAVWIGYGHVRGDSTEPAVSGADHYGAMLTCTENDDELIAEFTYDRRILAGGRWSQRWREALVALASDRSALETEVLPAEERALIDRINDTGGRFTAEGTLADWLDVAMGTRADAMAVRDGGVGFSYSEVGSRTARLAAHLSGYGVGPESVVALCLDRGIDLVCAMLAAVRLGAAFLCVDPSYPAARIRMMLDDATPAVVVGSPAPELLPAGVPAISVHEALDASVVESSGSETVTGAHAAYLLYTSGSTGEPKGVVNTHAGLVNRIGVMQEAHGLGAADRVLVKAPTGFDVSVREVLWPLSAGATLIIARPGGHLDPGYLVELIEREGVTVIQMVPSLLGPFLDAIGPECCPSLKVVLCGGEALTPELRDRVFAKLPQAKLFNQYGPTEAAIDVTEGECRPSDGPVVTIGAPVANTRLRVLDGGLRELPLGCPGELYLSGIQLARGYHGRPGLTAERFVPDPQGFPGARMYRTGDRVRRGESGDVEFLGRDDDQVKIRGVRIELGEVEAGLRALPGVRDAAAAVIAGHHGGERLIGYVVCRKGGPAPQEIKELMAARLPSQAVPSVVVLLDRLPLSPSGKLDRRALSAPAVHTVPGPESVMANDTERQIARAWCEVLGADAVGREENFFDIGGDSLLLLRLHARLVRDDPRFAELTITDLLARPSVAAQAGAVRGDVSTATQTARRRAEARRKASRQRRGRPDGPVRPFEPCDEGHDDAQK
ncbi:amino acid adenylation domain-containing protein [Catenulispora sp. EB89]|uniref:non-ribosomal peptide synthetase n=1 Tax=Catenulispora sp. EB89 TaxID=3156257 RepID=UPI003515FEF2